MKTLAAVLAMAFVFAGVSPARAGVKTEVVEYRHGGVVLEGYLAFDDSIRGKRPGVVVVHEWYGHTPYVRMRAEQLARLGYVAFALDMYGKGVRAKDAKEAAALAGIYMGDRKLMRARAAAGLDVLRNRPEVDPARLAAIGYCFGGTTVLEMARSGADLVSVVSFHGLLNTPNPGDARNIKGKVLVLHGGDDPSVPMKQVEAFQEEMRKGGVDWQFISYGGAVHRFTNPEAGSDNSKGAAYNERADRRSWEAMKAFFAETLK
ncbi:dienelactone hydrolase family protein [Candidatus Deferrimicrobium sp.]|uniref:dienelactone hydrolase family protein n=1 Tax=Candidatus Deferrimicrobium sp. TaxID=3060586 RepID=UPI002ED2E4D7